MSTSPIATASAGASGERVADHVRTGELVAERAVEADVGDGVALQAEPHQALARRGTRARAGARVRRDRVDVIARVDRQPLEIGELATERGGQLGVERGALAERAVGAEGEHVERAIGLVLDEQQPPVGKLRGGGGLVDVLEARHADVPELHDAVPVEDQQRVDRLDGQERQHRQHEPPAEHAVGRAEHAELRARDPAQPVELVAHRVVDVLPGCREAPASSAGSSPWSA